MPAALFRRLEPAIDVEFEEYLGFRYNHDLVERLEKRVQERQAQGTL